MANCKDYREAAQCIARLLDTYDDDKLALYRQGVAAATRIMADMFRRDNRTFSYEKFYEACGLDEWGVES